MKTYAGRYKTVFSILSLALTGLVTIATSKSSDHPNQGLPTNANIQGVYLVASNCPHALTQERVIIGNGRIISPAQLDYIQFGLPMAEFDIAKNQVVTGFVDGISRSCQYLQVTSQGVPLDVYTCFENNQLICQVSFEKSNQ